MSGSSSAARRAVAMAAAAVAAAGLAAPSMWPAARPPAVRAQMDAPVFRAPPVDQFGGRIAVIAAGDHSTVWMGHGPRVAAVVLNDPAAPVVAGRTRPLDGPVVGLAVDGGTAVAVTSGAAAFGGTAPAVGGGLAVVDVRDVAAPAVLGWTALTGTVGSAVPVALHDGRAYVVRTFEGAVGEDGAVASHSGLSVVDVRRPDAPRVVVADVVPAPHQVRDVVVVGDVLAVAVASGTDDTAGIVTSLQLFRLAGDAPPTLLTEHEDPAWRVLARESGPAPRPIVYGQGSGGLALDVSDPAEPREVRRWDGSTWCASCLRLVVDAAGAVSIVTPGAFGGGYVASVGDGGQVANALKLSIRPTGGAAAVGDHVVLADVGGEVRVLDLRLAAADRGTDPTLGRLSVPGESIAVAFRADAADGLAYVAAWEGGLRALSLAHPTHPPLVGAWRSPAYRDGLHVSGGWALSPYLGQDDMLGVDALDVFALDRPTDPAPIGRLYDGDLGRVLRAGGRDWAIVGGARRAGGTGGAVTPTLSVYALTSASAGEQEPSVADTPAGSIALAHDVRAIDLDGTRLVAVGYDAVVQDGPLPRAWLEVVDFQDPTRPARVASTALGLPPGVEDGLPLVALEGAVAVVAAPVGGYADDERARTTVVARVDVAGAAPRVTASVALSGTVASVAYKDGFAFAGPVACPTARRCVAVLDARQPDALPVAGWLALPADLSRYDVGPDAIAVRGRHVYVAAGGQGVWVYAPPLGWAGAVDGAAVWLPWLGREAGGP